MLCPATPRIVFATLATVLPQSAVARETALELVLTLTALVRALPPGRLVLFPQVTRCSRRCGSRRRGGPIGCCAAA